MCPDCAHLGNRPPHNPAHDHLKPADAALAARYRERDEDEVFFCTVCGSVLYRNPTVGWVFTHLTWSTDKRLEALRRSA